MTDNTRHNITARVCFVCERVPVMSVCRSWHSKGERRHRSAVDRLIDDDDNNLTKSMNSLQALDLWMAGCMMFVFAALGEFVVVKVLDKQYQMNKSKQQDAMPRIIPVVRCYFYLTRSLQITICLKSSQKVIIPFSR